MSTKCGTYAGYNEHRAYGSPVCADCRKAAADYARARRRRNGETTRTLVELRASKRFTDAELAAEHYRAKWTISLHIQGGCCDWRDPSKWHARVEAIERFATTCSYDEVAE